VPRDLLDDPIWLCLLAEDPNTQSVLGFRIDHGDSTTALARLTTALGTASSGTAVIVLADRRCLRTLLLHLSGPRSWFKMLRTATLISAMERGGVTVHGQYLVWPSIDHRRIVAPPAQPMWRWAQRAGVLGGGRASPALRLYFRSVLFAPLIRGFASGIAVIGRKD
jgi:hypothetical protein